MNGNGHDERLQDYLDGRMTDDERRAFEDRLARDPDLAAHVEVQCKSDVGLVGRALEGRASGCRGHRSTSMISPGDPRTRAAPAAASARQ